MENSWSLLRGAMHSADVPKGLSKGTIRRVYQFAGPHRGKLAVFLALTVISAVITCASA